MKCPVCKQTNTKVQNLKGAGFAENIIECKICGTSWSVNHGMTGVIKDTQDSSFLQCGIENVEAYDYDYVA